VIDRRFDSFVSRGDDRLSERLLPLISSFECGVSGRATRPALRRLEGRVAYLELESRIETRTATPRCREAGFTLSGDHRAGHPWRDLRFGDGTAAQGYARRNSSYIQAALLARRRWQIAVLRGRGR
jgi:hypothetical protein